MKMKEFGPGASLVLLWIHQSIDRANGVSVMNYMPFGKFVSNKYESIYRSGTLNSNTVNSKFHLIRSFFEIFARFLSFHV